MQLFSTYIESNVKCFFETPGIQIFLSLSTATNYINIIFLDDIKKNVLPTEILFGLDINLNL